MNNSKICSKFENELININKCFFDLKDRLDSESKDIFLPYLIEFVKKQNEFINEMFLFSKKVDAVLNDMSVNLIDNLLNKDTSFDIDSLSIKLTKNIIHSKQEKFGICFENNLQLIPANNCNKVCPNKIKKLFTKYNLKKNFSNNNINNSILTGKKDLKSVIKENQEVINPKVLYRSKSQILDKPRNSNKINIYSNFDSINKNNNDFIENHTLNNNSFINLVPSKKFGFMNKITNYIKLPETKNKTIELEFYNESICRNKSDLNLIAAETFTTDSNLKFPIKNQLDLKNEKDSSQSRMNFLGSMLNRHYQELDKFYQKYEDKYILHNGKSKSGNLNKSEIKNNHKFFLKSCERKFPRK